MPTAPHNDEVKQAFLDEFAKCGVVGHAMRAVGVKDYGTVRRWRQDEVFDAAFRDAEEEASDYLEAEARRRAAEGVTRHRYDKDGKLVSTETVYSDSLLMFLLKGRKRAVFGDRSALELSNPDGSMTSESPTTAAARIAAMLEEARMRRDAAKNDLPDIDEDELFQ